MSAETTLRNCPTFYYADDQDTAIYAYEVSGGYAHIRMPFGLANGEYTIYGHEKQAAVVRLKNKVATTTPSQGQ